MIQLQGITKSFGSLQVLRGIDLNIDKGEIVSIVGPSGAGKTTLLQIMGTLDAPDSGMITIDGTLVGRMKEKELSAFRNKHIGFVFQFHQLLPEFTALENVMIPAFIAGVGQKEATASALELLDFIEQIGMSDISDVMQGDPDMLNIEGDTINFVEFDTDESKWIVYLNSETKIKRDRIEKILLSFFSDSSTLGDTIGQWRL